MHPRLAALLATPAAEAVRARIRAEVRARVVTILDARSALVDGAQDDLLAARRGLGALERALARAAHRRERGPAHGGLTVHAAHDRDPGVAAIFARRGLPACPACAVGADETLAEAAFGEDFALDTLLAELNALPGFAASPGSAALPGSAAR